MTELLARVVSIFLLLILTTSAHAESRTALIEQAFKVTRRLVLQNTKQKQVPWETSSLTGDFYLLPQSEKVAPVAKAKPEPEIDLCP